MSHTVTVTRTTTSGTASAIIINTGYCKTTPGLLKIIEVILGGLVVGGTIHYWDRYAPYFHSEMFFLCIATTFFIGSLLLLLGCLISLSTGSIIAKTSYEFIYHGGAFVLYLIASGWLLLELNKQDFNSYYKPIIFLDVLAIVLTVLYLVSSVLAYRSYRWL